MIKILRFTILWVFSISFSLVSHVSSAAIRTLDSTTECPEQQEMKLSPNFDRSGDPSVFSANAALELLNYSVKRQSLRSPSLASSPLLLSIEAETAQVESMIQHARERGVCNQEVQKELEKDPDFKQLYQTLLKREILLSNGKTKNHSEAHCSSNRRSKPKMLKTRPISELLSFLSPLARSSAQGDQPKSLLISPESAAKMATLRHKVDSKCKTSDRNTFKTAPELNVKYPESPAEFESLVQDRYGSGGSTDNVQPMIANVCTTLLKDPIEKQPDDQKAKCSLVDSEDVLITGVGRDPTTHRCQVILESQKGKHSINLETTSRFLNKLIYLGDATRYPSEHSN